MILSVGTKYFCVMHITVSDCRSSDMRHKVFRSCVNLSQRPMKLTFESS